MIPAGGVTAGLADAALLATVPNTPTAAKAAPRAPPRRRLLLVIVIVLPDLGRRGVRGPHPRVRRRTDSVRETAVTFIAFAGRKAAWSHSDPGCHAAVHDQERDHALISTVRSGASNTSTEVPTHESTPHTPIRARGAWSPASPPAGRRGATYPIGREVHADPGTAQSPERVLAAGTLAELDSRNDGHSGCQPEFGGTSRWSRWPSSLRRWRDR